MPTRQRTTQYKHRRLKSPRSIRVLTLAPSPATAALLEVSLTEIPLDATSSRRLSYEALSYVWGAPKGDRPLICDGEQLLVTPNCESALRHLRDGSVARTLWVDSICIDQGDSDESVRERNAQVALMGEVYHQATRTFCWLGEGNEYTTQVFAHLEKIGQCPSKRGLKKLLKFDENLTRRGLLETGSTCLEQVFCHPWHFRIWTVQEVAHSKDCYVMCGPAILPWDVYANAAKFLIYEEYIDAFDMPAFRAYVTIDTRAVLRDFIFDTPASSAGTDEDEKDRKAFFLTSCLSQVRHLHATDSKDKIYGLYAVFSSLGIRLPAPDYTKPLDQVYEDATISIIIYSRNLRVLEYASSNSRLKSLPSWVPDWQDEDVKLFSPTFNATEDSVVAEADPKHILPIPGRLAVRGKIVGTVESRSENDFSTLEFPAGPHPDGLPIMTKESYDSVKDTGALRLLIHRVKCFREWQSLIRTATPHDGAEWQDMFYDLLHFFKKSSSRPLFDIWTKLLLYPDTTHDLSVGETLAQQWETADSSNAPNWTDELRRCAILAAYIVQVTELPDLMASLSGNMGDRALVLIRDHALKMVVVGTAFHAVRQDDVVVLLEGLDSPVVLRAQKEQWHFIGPTFMPGVMDGEAWSDEDGTMRGLRDFVLI